jgi:anti-sigma factor RsiW
MTGISDEVLMSYADGELDTATAAQVEAALVHDHDARARFAVFAATGRVLGEMYSKPMHQPVPQQLVDAVLSANPGATGGAVPSAKIIPFDRVTRAKQPPVTRWMLAAACVSIIAVAAGSRWIADMPRHNFDATFGIATARDGTRIAGVQLAAALETVPSGTASYHIIDGTAAAVKPVLSFAATVGGYCRQYEITNDKSDNALAGVACRSAQSGWQIEGQAVTAAAQRPQSAIRPASNDSSAEIDALVERLMSGDAIGLEEEAGVMREGWRSISSPALDSKP